MYCIISFVIEKNNITKLLGVVEMISRCGSGDNNDADGLHFTYLVNYIN